MKKSLLYIFLALTVLAGCDKNDGPVPDDVKLERVPQPQIVRNGGNVAIDVLNPASFQGKFDLAGVYFPSDVPPSKMDVVIRKNNNNSNVKVIQAGVTTYPTTLTLTSAQLATLFGAPVALGDNYEISADVYTQDGKKYEAFPNIPGVNRGWGSGIAGQPGASPSLIYSVICAYSPTLFGPIGSTSAFEVLTDEWGDDPVNGWGPPAGYRPEVMVTVVDDTHLSFKSPVNGTSTIVLTVNPLTNAITFTNQPYGDFKVGPLQVDPGYPYGPATVSNRGPNSVSPCDLKINLAMTYNVSAGTFAMDASRGYFLVLKKK